MIVYHLLNSDTLHHDYTHVDLHMRPDPFEETNLHSMDARLANLVYHLRIKIMRYS